MKILDKSKKGKYKSVWIDSQTAGYLQGIKPFFDNDDYIEILDAIIESELGHQVKRYSGKGKLKKADVLKGRSRQKTRRDGKSQKLYPITMSYLEKLKTILNMSKSDIVNQLVAIEYKEIFENKHSVIWK